ncbi:MAG: YtxH domain-containing protein [Bacteroidota bacterium]
MSDSKFITGILIGAVVGTALALFLNSEKGKALMKDLKEGADNLQSDLSGLADELLQKGKSFMEETEQAS